MRDGGEDSRSKGKLEKCLLNIGGKSGVEIGTCCCIQMNFILFENI